MTDDTDRDGIVVPARIPGRHLGARRLALLKLARYHGIAEHTGTNIAERTYTVRVRGEQITVPADDLEVWLVGVADAHGVGHAFRVP